MDIVHKIEGLGLMEGRRFPTVKTICILSLTNSRKSDANALLQQKI